MKKIYALLLAVFLAAGISACSGPTGLPGVTGAVKAKVPRSMKFFQPVEETEQNTEAEAETEQTEDTQIAETLAKMIDMPETLLLQEEGIEIYVNGYAPDGSDISLTNVRGPAFRLRGVNHTDKPLLFTVANSSVNGFEMQSACAFTVEPQSEAESVLYTYNNDNDFLGMDALSELEAWFVIFEAENLNTRYLLADPVAVDLPLGDAYSFDNPEGETIYDQDGVRVILFDEPQVYQTIWFGNDYFIHGLVVNESDKAVLVESEDFTVNGTIAKPVEMVVRSGRKGLLTVNVRSSDLEEAGQSTLNSASGSFKISKIEDLTAQELEETTLAQLDPINMAFHLEEDSLGFVLMDEGGVKATLDSIFEDPLLGTYGISLTVENNSEKEVVISPTEIYINGLLYGKPFIYERVKPGEKVNRRTKLSEQSSSFMEEYEIGEIKTITARCGYSEKETIYTDDDFTFQPFVSMTLDESEDASFRKPEALFLTETQGIRFSLVSYGTKETEAFDGSGTLIHNLIYLMVENASETDVQVKTAGKTRLNDGEPESYDRFNIAVPSGCCAIEPVDLSFQEKPFSEGDTIHLELDMADLSNGASLERGLTFILTFE